MADGFFKHDEMDAAACVVAVHGSNSFILVMHTAQRINKLTDPNDIDAWVIDMLRLMPDDETYILRTALKRQNVLAGRRYAAG